MSMHSRRFWNASTAICALVFGTSGAAHAQQAQPAAQPVYDLGTIDIVAARGTPLDRLDISTSVVTQEQVQEAPQTSVDQILNKIPGIYIPQQPTTQLHPTGQTLNIRGFGTTTNGLVLVLVDGVPVNDAYFRSVNWAEIPKEEVERIEVIRGGGATSLWGNMAMGGVINIVTREPGNGFNHATGSYGSFNTFNGSVAQGWVDGPWKFGLSYDGASSSGYNQTPKSYLNPTYMGPTASTVGVFNGSVYYSPDASAKYFAKLLLSRTDENGLVWNLASNQWTNVRISAGGMQQIAPDTMLNLTGWYQDSSMATANVNGGNAYTITNPASALPNISTLEDANYWNAGGSAYVQSEFSGLKDVKAGVDFRTITVRDPLNLYAYPGPPTASPFAQLTNSATNRFEGIFAQGTYRVNPLPLDVTVGLREDFWQALNGSTVGYLAKVLPATPINNQLANNQATHFDPRLGLKYYFDNGLDLRAAAYENFAAPGMNQLYREFQTGRTLSIANPTLTPQTNQGVEAGFDYKQQKYELSGTVFLNNIKNYIDFVYICGTAVTPACKNPYPGVANERSYVNAGDAVMRGFELMGSYHVLENLTFNGGIARTDAFLTRTVNAAYDPTDNQLGQVPPWMLNLGVAWNPLPKLTVNVQAKIFPAYFYDTLHSVPNSGAAVFDAAVSYKALDNVEVFASVQNIGNRQYYDVGPQVANAAPPQLAMPLNATGGVRVTW